MTDGSSSYVPYDLNEDDLALLIKEFIYEMSIALTFQQKHWGVKFRDIELYITKSFHFCVPNGDR